MSSEQQPAPRRKWIGYDLDGSWVGWEPEQHAPTACDLVAHGYAPGDYYGGQCVGCKAALEGVDKGTVRCFGCATKAAQAKQTPQAGDTVETAEARQAREAETKARGEALASEWAKKSASMAGEPLKSCPFCGSSEIDPKGWAGDGGRHGPVCDKCGAMAESVETWNRRTESTAPQAGEGLKPCPFCGGEPSVTARPGFGAETGAHVCFVACMCGGYSARAHQHGSGDTPEAARLKAFASWNTRAEPDALVRERQARQEAEAELALLRDAHRRAESLAGAWGVKEIERVKLQKALLEIIERYRQYRAPEPGWASRPFCARDAFEIASTALGQENAT